MLSFWAVFAGAKTFHDLIQEEENGDEIPRDDFCRSIDRSLSDRRDGMGCVQDAVGRRVGATSKGDPVDVAISGPSVSGYQFKAGCHRKFFDRSAEDGDLSRRLSERRDPSHADW
jgi:hypothetical protein